jgi:hypothetical protein
MQFTNIKQAVSSQFTTMSQGVLLTTDVDKYELWDLYLASFPEGTNPVFRERTEHDCNCCKQFIRAAGNVVSFINGELVSIWDVEVGGYYQVVADALSAYVKSKVINGIFLHYEKAVGTDQSLELNEDGNIVWNHFHQTLPTSVVKPKHDIATLKGKAMNNYNVLKRSITEITSEAISTVSELIDTKVLYRGAEHKSRVQQLSKLKEEYGSASHSEEFLWTTSLSLGEASSFRNSVIGTLLCDLSEGKDLEQAVKSFETKVAPSNYKRSSALITQSMIDRASETVTSLGYSESLQRRHAVLEDLTINNVIYADRSAKKAMGAFDSLMPTAPTESKGKPQEISIEDFIATIVPKTESMELLLTNDYQQNFMTLVSPVNKEAKGMLKWNNNFSWAYDGDVTDSGMKENVKKAGGNVDGVLRFSIQWNTPERSNQSDLDAHCREPNGHIYFRRMHGGSNSGTLDVDIQRPRGIAVENIIYTNIERMADGDYKFYVNNYIKRAGSGFTAEIEFNGQIFEFNHDGTCVPDVVVGIVNKKGNSLTLKESLPHSKSSVNKWNLESQQFHKVNAMMFSPNHWDNNTAGNKHTFFILENCVNPEPVRGFYNEFLSTELHDHRKVFEHLGSRMKAAASDIQMSGLGFSETLRNQVIIKCDGRQYKVVF